MARSLGKLEARILAYTQMRGGGAIGIDELARRVRLSKEQVQRAVARLARDGMVARVSRGKYIFPERLPLGGKWNPGEIVAINALMDDKGGSYQICGPNAFNKYGFSEQIPNRLYAYNNRISGTRTVGGVQLVLIKVDDGQLGSTEEFGVNNDAVAVYSSRSRTLVDAVCDWSRFGSLPGAYGWIRDELASGRVKIGAFVSDAIAYGNQGTLRRIGAVLDMDGVGARYLSRIKNSIRPSKSQIALIPNSARRGRLDKRWGVIVNVPE